MSFFGPKSISYAGIYRKYLNTTALDHDSEFTKEIKALLEDQEWVMGEGSKLFYDARKEGR